MVSRILGVLLTLGIAVFAGMVGVTLFGIFLTPIFFYNIDRLGESPWLNTPFMRLVRYVVTFGFIHSLFRKVGK